MFFSSCCCCYLILTYERNETTSHRRSPNEIKKQKKLSSQHTRTHNQVSFSPLMMKLMLVNTPLRIINCNASKEFFHRLIFLFWLSRSEINVEYSLEVDVHSKGRISVDIRRNSVDDAIVSFELIVVLRLCFYSIFVRDYLSTNSSSTRDTRRELFDSVWTWNNT